MMEVLEKLKYIDISDERNLFVLLTTALKLKNHDPSGPIYSSLQKQKGNLYYQSKEYLEAIYHFSESHYPSLRTRTSFRYDRVKSSCTDTSKLTLNKHYVEFKCNSDKNSEINQMLQRVKDMPEEWTIVQLTAFDLNMNRVPFEELKKSTPQFFMSVISCGTDLISPICIKIDKLDDNILQDIQSIINELSVDATNVLICPQVKNGAKLKEIMSKVEFKWLNMWRIFFLGKLVKSDAQDCIFPKIHEIFEIHKCENLTEIQKQIILHTSLSSTYLNLAEISRLIHTILPDNKQMAAQLARTIYDLSLQHSKLIKGPRLPVLLIVDQQLDHIPWEVCEVMQNQPVSRMPSLHFTYGLYKEHEINIVGGYFINTNPAKGAYVVNPELNLNDTEMRMKSFYQYWLPEWNGVFGQCSSDQFKDLLTNCDIFAYSGHGSGTQIMSGDIIQKLRVRAVVLLFGCGSVSLRNGSGFSEQQNTYDHYLVACSPCVVGNLWNVTSKEMDVMSAILLSLCTKSSTADKNWDEIDLKKWSREGKIVPLKKQSPLNKTTREQEVNLLLAIAATRKKATMFLNEAAFIARGLPVLIQHEV